MKRTLLMLMVWFGSTTASAAGTREKVEDFDSTINWAHLKNRPTDPNPLPNMDYGYSSTNNVGSPLATGEIGGSISRSGISWLADVVAHGSTNLNASVHKLTASGHTRFTNTGGNVTFGWFNGNYAAPSIVPDNFIGWRQNGTTLYVAVGINGTSFINGAPTIPFTNGTTFSWTMTWEPGTRLLTLTVGGSSSTLSLNDAQLTSLVAKGGFNRFGIVTPNNTGLQTSTAWFDNLIYTKVSGYPTISTSANRSTELFDRLPDDWVGRNNISNVNPHDVTQSYRHQPTGGRSGGCVGGGFTQSVRKSYFAYDYIANGHEPRHLDQKLRSEGWLKVPSFGNVGKSAHFGWTNKKVVAFREQNSLGIRLTNENGDAITLISDYGTRNFNIGGSGSSNNGFFVEGPDPDLGQDNVIAAFQPGDVWHHYVLEFEPEGVDEDDTQGRGTVTVTFDNHSTVPPTRTVYKYFPRPDHTESGADFDLFGMWNGKSGAEIDRSELQVFLDDVVNTIGDPGVADPSSNAFNGTPAGWVGANNDTTYGDVIVRPRHQFGWTGGLSPLLQPVPPRHAMGGVIWCVAQDIEPNDRASYGANVVVTRQLNHGDTLFVTGKMKLDWWNTDAHYMFGWYREADAVSTSNAAIPENFLGVCLGRGEVDAPGFRPCYRTANDPQGGTRETEGPRILRHDRSPKVYPDGNWVAFFIGYDPAGAGGNGEITVQIGENGTPASFPLDADAKSIQRGMTFDRFGLVTRRRSGKGQAPYFDQLTYTVSP